MIATRGWRATFSSLENRNYRWYWLSSTSAAAVMQMNLIARGWLVYDLTDSALALGLVSFGAGVPLFLLSPFGGAIADRMDKRNLIIASQLLMGVALLFITILISMDVIAMWHLVIAAIANGVLLAFNIPSRQSLVPQLVAERQVMNAVALNSGSQNLNRVIAPAAAGVMIGFAGVEGVYFLMVFFAVVSGLLMFFVPPVEEKFANRQTTVGSDILEGLRYVRRTPAILSLLVMAVVPILFGMPYMLLLPVFATDVLDVGPSGLGYLMSATGVGAVIGSIAVASLSDFKYKGGLLLAASVLFGGFLILFACSTSFWLAFFFLLGVGMGNAGYMAINNSLLLLNSEERMRGRVMSLYMMSIAVFPMAVLPAGAIIESVGAPLVLGAGGVVVVIFTIAMALLRPTLRRL